jgi:hypothetical protein
VYKRKYNRTAETAWNPFFKNKKYGPVTPARGVQAALILNIIVKNNRAIVV